MQTNLNICIVNSLDENVWREFVDKHPQGNIFHTPEMFRVFDCARGCRSQLFAAVNGSGQVLALLAPVLVSLRGGPLRQLMTRSIAYGGVLCVPGPEGHTALRALLRENDLKTKKEALYTELRNLSDVEPVRETLSECGYVYEEHLDYLIDLAGLPEQVMQNIGSRTRKNIRHALRKGNINIEVVSRASQIPAWYELVKKSYTAARVPLSDISLFQAAYDVLAPKGMARFYLARIGSVYVAATAELPYKDIIYGWYSGVDRAYASEYPGELLMWEVLRWGAENGYKTYDFGGAGKPGEPSGVRDFKAKFGGQLVCYGRNTKIHAPHFLRMSKWGYDTYRQLRKLFPVSAQG